jgi:SAM-dependent methyltransferase
MAERPHATARRAAHGAPGPDSRHQNPDPMHPSTRLSAAVQARLRCPVCRGELAPEPASLRCTGRCGSAFPVVDGVPLLINAANSLFSPDDYVGRAAEAAPAKPLVRRLAKRLVPENTVNVAAERNYARFTGLMGDLPAARVLVVGGRIAGAGIERLLSHPSIEVVETDVSFGPRTAIICDGHDLPFADGSFDGVVAQAVLEHVLDPHRCVDEIHRVLAPGGVVYAETPFMQQVHAGRYDFTRFTHLGHRRLFRRFEEIDSGAACGPGMALAWSYQYFLTSFVDSAALRQAVLAFARSTSFFLKYFDRYLVRRAGAIDAASAFYFLGRRAEVPLDDRELIKLYRGGLAGSVALH